MLDNILKFSVIPLVIFLVNSWLNTPIRNLNSNINYLKKAPKGCNPPEPWDPNFKNYETIEEKQRVAETPDETPNEVCLRSLRGIEMILQREELQLILNDSASDMSDSEN